jgi:DNA-directed RNA polymerase specialized sigma24 family protein
VDGLSIQDLKVVLGEVVDALPPIEGAVLTALYWEGLSLGEVAEMAHCSVRTVARVRDRAFKRIRGLTNE